jgi:hypothetical protein
MGFSGTPSASNPALFLVAATHVERERAGALVYSSGGPQFVPYPGGVRCLAAPRTVLSRQWSGGSPAGSACSGALGLDFNALIRSGADPLLVPGHTVNAQWIFRDPTGPSALASSEAIEFTIQL